MTKLQKFFNKNKYYDLNLTSEGRLKWLNFLVGLRSISLSANNLFLKKKKFN